MNSKRLVLGIDLGTTNSACAILEDGQVRVLPNRLDESLTPSCVGLDPKDQALLIGRAARELSSLQPERCVSTFKRGMGLDTQYRLLDKDYGAIELSAMVLKALKADAEACLGQELSEAVITVPAYFNEAQRFSTVKAGELAGLKVLRILNEPTAAAMAYGLHKLDEDGHFLVFDLGGGTFDVCVMELFSGILHVKSTAGESRLGGEDFTRRLLSKALGDIGLSYERVEMADPGATGLLLKRVEKAKRQLSKDTEVSIEMPPLKGLTENPVPLTLSRADTEAAWKPLLERLYAPCRAALRGAHIDADELDEIILVGGATRMPCVRELVEEVFGRAPKDAIDPDLAVVQGAALQAALCARDEAVEELVVVDVASHSLGIEVAKELGNRHLPGYFSPIIHRNSVIPMSRTETYATVMPNQREMILEIYEGESRRVKDNRHLGKLVVKGIPQGNSNQAIEVTFTYDVNGLLEVVARIVATGKVFSQIFTRNSQALGPEAIEKAKKRMAALKEDPRKRAKHKDLLHRAESLWKDLPAEGRGLLGLALDAYETALESRNPKQIKDTFEQLSELCDRFDGGERW